MAVYPESPLPVYPVVIAPEWNTLIGRMDSGAEQRRQKCLFARYNVELHYQALSDANSAIIWEFYMARKGSFEEFWFFDPAPSLGIVVNHDALYVGTGDATTLTFDLPGKSTSAQKVYLDGVEQNSGLSYSYGTGDGTADQVVFASAPVLGEVITCDFTGALRIRCRFALDKLSRELFMTVLFNYGIQLKGLGPA